MKGGYTYLKHDFGLYLKIPGHPPRRRWLDLECEDKQKASPHGLAMMRRSPNIIVIRIGNLFATGSNLLII
jgi:hypothetical protein